MALLEIRQRTGYMLLAVILGHLVLISAQVTTPGSAGKSVLEAVTFGIFSEIQRAAANGFGGVRDAWEGYIALRGVQAENEVLRREVAGLRIRLQEEKAVAEQSLRLQRLLAMRERLPIATTAARVIAGDATSGFRTVTIDKGTADGLRVDMAVISPDGIVGRVIRAGVRAAMVQLLIDRDAGAGALIARSRAGGVVVGVEGDPPLRLDYVTNLADVRTGDVVVTSGNDRIYPKGVVVGRVEAAERGAGLYKSIKVRPAVDYGRLEEVLVVVGPPGGASIEGKE
ncbi:MAG: rod shape-determining protein MreC [Acidobacteria bacterium]|nr:rod shape-determining protein MreC [Acidobacteriota bacterium]